MKLPFNLILDRAFQIIDLIVLTDSFEMELILKEELDLFLDSAGWTESEFDSSLLEYIDNNWFPYIN